MNSSSDNKEVINRLQAMMAARSPPPTTTIPFTLEGLDDDESDDHEVPLADPEVPTEDRVRFTFGGVDMGVDGSDDYETPYANSAVPAEDTVRFTLEGPGDDESDDLETPPDDPAEDIASLDDTQDHPLDLTLGVEFEFNLLQDTQIDNTTTPDLHIDMVVAALTTPLCARCATCGKEHQFELFPNGYDPDPELYNQWLVDEDGTLTADKLIRKYPRHLGVFGHIRVHTIELKSRILHAKTNRMTTGDADKPGHRHEITYQEEIKAVLTRITDHFSPAKAPPGWLLVIDELCSLHVHIGNGNKCFPLPTAKNILSLYLANQKPIDAMHSLHRVDGSTLAHNPDDTDGRSSLKYSTVAAYSNSLRAYNRAFSDHFAHILHRLREARDSVGVFNTGWPIDYPELHPLLEKNDVASWLEVLNNADSVRKFEQLQFTSAHQSVIDTGNLLPYLGEEGIDEAWGKKLTFEFRQHAGTLDPDEALIWIDVLLRIVNHAHNNTTQQIFDRCMTNWQDPTYHTLQFLEQLGYMTTDQVFRHYRHVLGLERTSRTIVPYALECQQRDEAIAEAYNGHSENEDPFSLELPYSGEDHIFCQLLTYQASINSANRDYVNVRERIEEKFLAGCYGQFDPAFLSTLPYQPIDALTDEETEKLSLGYKATVTQQDSPTDTSRYVPFNRTPAGSRTFGDRMSPETDVGFSDDGVVEDLVAEGIVTSPSIGGTSPSLGGEARSSPEPEDSARQGRPGPVDDDIDDEIMEENLRVLAEYREEQRDRRTRERREREEREDEDGPAA